MRKAHKNISKAIAWRWTSCLCLVGAICALLNCAQGFAAYAGASDGPATRSVPPQGGGVSVVTVDAKAVVGKAAPDLWGIFLEDLDLALDGGLYAEMVRNRSFEDGTSEPWDLTLDFWNPVGNAEFYLDKSRPLGKRNRHACCVRGKPGAGIANEGYFGMSVKKGHKYNLSLMVRGKTSGAVEASLEAFTKPVLARAEFTGITDEWQKFNVTLVPNDDDKQARLVLRLKEGGEMYIDCVSMFPDDALCGIFRRDLVEKLAQLKPSFMRFPGGTFIKGDRIRNAYRWKETIGDVWERRTLRNFWRYWSTNGIGYHEYLLLAELLKAKPIYCINPGMARHENAPMDKMGEFVQDALDCIEYANGPVDSKWGALRAKAGHPEQFNMEYLEIGNEQGGPAYAERYALIAKAVREKYPQVKLIFAKWGQSRKVDAPNDIRDDHFYGAPSYFMGAFAHEYDTPKGDFGIFVGEYAVTRGVPYCGSLRGAIAEAAFMLGLERNPAQVKLAAYAPLFAHVQHVVWTPNLICHSGDGCFVNPSWNVQKLFSENRGAEVLKVSVETGREQKGIDDVQANAVRTEKGEIILKLVNCTEKPQRVTVKGFSGTVRRTVFTGPGGDARNAPYDREAVKETSGEFTLAGSDTLPPLSLVIYRGASSQFPAYNSDSYLADVRDKATGFFRVVEKDGRWRVIDPLGRGMVLLGVDHVKYQGHHSQRTGRSIHLEVNKRKFPNKADWEEDTLARLKKWGFNLLGAGCDPALKHRGLVHTVFLSIGDSMCWDPKRPDLYICPNEHRPCSAFPNVFHPQFEELADQKARAGCAPHRDDPWLFGYFIDNELAWWGRGRAATGLFDAVAKLPDTHSAKIAQKKFLAERGVKGNPSDDDKLAFLKLAADIYFRVSSEAIRRHDPNHLVMGARFAGLWGAHPAVWEISGKYCDLVTFNVYPWADIDRNVVTMSRSAKAERAADAFTRQYGHVKKPMLVTEWSFPALDSGLPCTGGAGQRFRTQSERTRATELFARTMLSLPFFVGYDYFMWVDEPAAGISDAFPEDSNYGLINENGDAYPEITEMFTRLHKEVASGTKIAMPAERAAPKEKGGMTADEFLAARRDASPHRSGQGRVAFRRDGDTYEISNGAGLVLRGKVGGMYMFDSVSLKGSELGSYTGMLNDRVDGKLAWHDAKRVTDVEWKPSANGAGTLFVTSEGDCANGGKFSLKHAITLYAGSPRFLCELVEAKNVGCVPIDVVAFYFREYAPYFADKAAMKIKKVPNLWKAPMRAAWFRKSDGAYYGGLSHAPLATLFQYHIMDDGRSQHPDAMFTPEGKLVLAPGETYRPEGKMWMLAICGFGGVEGWRRDGIESGGD